MTTFLDGMFLGCFALSFFLFAHGGSARAAVSVSSPDGRVSAEVSTDESGNLQYEIRHGSQIVIEPSPIGVITGETNLGESVEIRAGDGYEVDESYPWRGIKSRVANQCDGLKIKVVHGPSGLTWTLELRAYDDGIAYRSIVPGTGERTIAGERAAWRMPEGTRIWCQDNTWNYEGLYAAYRIDREQHHRPERIGMPVTAELPSGLYACVTEADIMGYSGMSLTLDEAGVLQGMFEDNPEGWALNGEFKTPWRIVMVAETLDELVNNDIVHNVCPKPDKKLFPEGIETDWLKPGRCLWQWWAYDSGGTKWELQKDFVNKAAALNCQYYLVDEGWENPKYGWFGDANDPWVRMKELVDYANDKNVGIWVWKAWRKKEENKWPGIETPEKRQAFFAKCEEAGVVGTKIDFMDSESHDVLAFYHDCLRLGAKHKVMVNFHGANKPAGEPRTWPNEMTREGIRGLEYNKWSELPAYHYAVLPFTRMLAGHGDFTPTTFQKHMLKGTTVTGQLAHAVVYTSPFLCWADKPDVYLNSPVVDLIRVMPTTWDETHVLPGSQIGVLAVFARRAGEEWWIGGINGADHDMEYALKPTFLENRRYTATVVADNEYDSDELVLEKIEITQGATKSIKMRKGGGFVLRLQRP